MKKQNKTFKIIPIILFILLGQTAFANRVVCLYWGGNWNCEYQSGADCPKEGLSPNGRLFCKQLMIKPNTPPIIRTDLMGNSFLDNDGQVIKIASDKVIEFWKKNVDPTTKEIEAFYKNDNGVVSQKRLEAIAKELNAKIVNSTAPITPNYCPACNEQNIINTTKSNTKDLVTGTPKDCPQGFELKNGVCVPITTVTTSSEMAGGPIQGVVIKGGSNGGTHKVKRTGHVTLMRFSKPQIYIGGGVFSPSSTTKEAGLVNGIDINLSVYKPIWFWGNTSLGINAGGGYTTGNGDYALDNRYTVYNLQGQSAPPTVSEKGNGTPKNQGFKFEAGPQMNIHLGDVTVSPIFNVGYMSMEQKAFTVTETVQENTVDYPYDLLTQKATKTTGLGIIPKVRLAYNITPSIGIWVEGSYTMGSTINTESTRFVLDPNIPSDQYNLGHFQEGQYITTKTDTKYSAMGVSGGVVISLGSGKGAGAGDECSCCGNPSGRHDRVDCCLMNPDSATSNLQSGGNPLFKCQKCNATFDSAPDQAKHTCSATTSTPTSTVGFIKPSNISSQWKSLVPAGTQWFISGGSACQLEPGCGAGGIYCKANSPSFSEANYVLNEDEIMTASAIKLVGKNNIVIYNLGLKNKLTAATLQKFIDKKVDVQPTVLPLSLLSSLYKSIGLPEPKEPITFSKENITYEVMNTTNEGQKVQVIQINENTKINIDGKEYNVTVITTSGKGTGSPKSQDF